MITPKGNALAIADLSGIVVTYDDPTSEMIDLEAMCHALSLICRFNGHIPRHYSVAAHSCYVADLAYKLYSATADDPNDMHILCLEALIHDAHEAYICDIPSPQKKWLMANAVGFREAWRKLEGDFDAAIRLALGIDWQRPGWAHDIIKVADYQALQAEFRDLRPPGILDAYLEDAKGCPEINDMFDDEPAYWATQLKGQIGYHRGLIRG